MKNIVIVSVLCSLALSSAAFADIYSAPANQAEKVNRYTQQTVNTTRQIQNNVNNAYQNVQQSVQYGQQMYGQDRQYAQDVQHRVQEDINQVGQSFTNVQQAGQSYVDKNVQPIRQKTGDFVNSWSNQASDWQAKADSNQQIWNQAIRAYENSYNESYSRNWDKMMDNYQKSKKL